MGWASVDELKKLLSKENPISIEYVDSSEIKITDYFDITQNSWSNKGVSDALIERWICVSSYENNMGVATTPRKLLYCDVCVWLGGKLINLKLDIIFVKV